MLQDGLHPSDRFRTLHHDNSVPGRPIRLMMMLRRYYNASGRPVIITMLSEWAVILAIASGCPVLITTLLDAPSYSPGCVVIITAPRYALSSSQCFSTGRYPDSRFTTLRHYKSAYGRAIMFVRTSCNNCNASGRPVVIAMLQDRPSS